MSNTVRCAYGCRLLECHSLRIDVSLEERSSQNVQSKPVSQKRKVGWYAHMEEKKIEKKDGPGNNAYLEEPFEDTY